MLMTPAEPISIHDAKILLVDDEIGNLRVLERLLRNAGYTQILAANGGTQGLELFLVENPDLVVLDLKMPHLSGHEVMKKLREIQVDDYLPILVLTAQHDPETRLEALQGGAKDFLTKPFHMPEVLARVRNMLEVRLLHNKVRYQNLHLEERILERTCELEGTRSEIIHRLARAAEYRDNETGMHVMRMSKYCELLARGAGLPDAECTLIEQASAMHDVGKIGIPDRILLKPGKLDLNEWGVMKTHCEIGGTILSGSDSELMNMAESIALTHHEQWCGRGYPHGLAGEAIPMEGRITSICDVYDALTSERPYKKAWTVDKALEEIQEKAGILFDAELVKVFHRILPQILEIGKKYADTEEPHLYKVI
ncbi:MAG: HD domain-containing phosphohydrolase [Nitrospinaceae bacterium]